MVIGRAITMPAETLDLVELSSKKLSFMTLDDPNLININSNGKLNRYASLKWGVFSHWISENFLKGFKIEKSGMKPFFTESHGCYRLQLFLFFDDPGLPVGGINIAEKMDVIAI
jgi:hypothetical protein